MQDLKCIVADIIEQDRLSMSRDEKNARREPDITHEAMALERSSIIHASMAAGLLAKGEKTDTLAEVPQRQGAHGGFDGLPD